MSSLISRPSPADAFKEKLRALLDDRSKTNGEIAGVIVRDAFILALVDRRISFQGISRELRQGWRYETLQLISHASQKRRGLGCDPDAAGFKTFWRQVVW